MSCIGNHNTSCNCNSTCGNCTCNGQNTSCDCQAGNNCSCQSTSCSHGTTSCTSHGQACTDQACSSRACSTKTKNCGTNNIACKHGLKYDGTGGCSDHTVGYKKYHDTCTGETNPLTGTLTYDYVNTSNTISTDGSANKCTHSHNDADNNNAVCGCNSRKAYDSAAKCHANITCPARVQYADFRDYGGIECPTNNGTLPQGHSLRKENCPDNYTEQTHCSGVCGANTSLYNNKNKDTLAPSNSGCSHGVTVCNSHVSNVGLDKRNLPCTSN